MRRTSILLCLVSIWMNAMVDGLEKSMRQQSANSMVKILETSVKVGDPNRGPTTKDLGKTPAARKGSVKKKEGKDQTATSGPRLSVRRKSKKGRTARQRSRKNIHATEDRRAKILADVKTGVSKLVEHVNILPQVETDLKPLLLKRLKQHLNVLIPPPKEFRRPGPGGPYDTDDEYEYDDYRDEDYRERGTGRIGQDREMSNDYHGKRGDESRWGGGMPRKMSIDEEAKWGTRTTEDIGWRPRTKLGEEKDDYSSWSTRNEDVDTDWRRSKIGEGKNEEEPETEKGTVTEEEEEEEEEEPMLDLASTWLNEELDELKAKGNRSEDQGENLGWPETRYRLGEKDGDDEEARKRRMKQGEEVGDEVTKRRAGSGSSSKAAKSEGELSEVSQTSKDKEEPMKFEEPGNDGETTEDGQTGMPKDSTEEFGSKVIRHDRNVNEDEPA